MTKHSKTAVDAVNQELASFRSLAKDDSVRAHVPNALASAAVAAAWVTAMFLQGGGK